MRNAPPPPPQNGWTRRNYLLAVAYIETDNPMLAIEAVNSTLLEHPEWDPSETKTWAEWEE